MAFLYVMMHPMLIRSSTSRTCSVIPASVHRLCHWSSLASIIAGYHNQATPTIVLACKSDLQKLISPNDALLIVQPYAGIIEVSSETDSGKSKMRRCVDVFVKLALKSRGEYCCIISRVIQ